MVVYWGTMGYQICPSNRICNNVGGKEDRKTQLEDFKLRAHIFSAESSFS